MGISVTQLLILLVIVAIVFGTKRLRTVGTDLGDAIKNFRAAIKAGEQEKTAEADAAKTIDGESVDKDSEKTTPLG